MASSTTARSGAAGARGGTKGVARGEREEQILAVAGAVFGEQGYAATSVADIAARAGISKPLIYNYFGSKDGLFERVVGEAAALIVTEIERSARLGAVGVERGLVTLDGVFGVLEGRIWTWQVVNDPTAPTTGSIATVQDACRRRLEELAAEGVGELLRLAGVTDPLDVEAMTAVWGQVFATLVTWWTQHPDVTREQMTARCVRLFDAVLAR
ncbi:TetR/AcrR family transcriptional regulator [Nocardioides sp.]|uniref:TetR/AcrR family transcriptional regulator n=1 Tax=Nocardioides sp. TaxID=35761 RepID=UPI003512AD3B